MPLKGNGTVEGYYGKEVVKLISGMFEVEGFYEIDHAGLPPKSPIQLKAIRVVKVSETTRLDVTVRFPSVLALRNYFAGDLDTGRNPELDEKFVMGTNQAVRILKRMVPEMEMDEEKHMKSFWVVSPTVLDCPPTMVVVPAAKVVVEEEMQSPPVPGGCLFALKSAGVLAWGARRKVKYIGRHREVQAIGMKEEEEEEEEEEGEMTMEKKRSREEGCSKKERKKKKMKKSVEKRNKKKKKKKKVIREEEEEEQSQRSRERWSSERYEAAELKLLDIMREKGAKLGKPIIRQALREEARKHIGDTGLLDHLLKHMAGKTIADGAERFRRRHNAEGAMEYWLEPADLVEIRRKAGVADPYWVPPPGWKLGDAIVPCQCGSECKLQLIQLKDELTNLKRDMEQQPLSSQKQLEVETRESQSEAEKGSSPWQ
ncbi:P-loop containing nucleoside triphosphate hydrolase protein, partial [Dioscorea alata]